MMIRNNIDHFVIIIIIIIIVVVVVVVYRSEVTLYIMEQSSLGSLSVVLANNTYIHLQNQTRKVTTCTLL